MIRFIMVAVVLAALVLAPPAARLLGNQYLLSLATTATIFALAAASLQLIVGQGGLVSFGHAAYLGIGAYAPLILGAAGWPDAALSVPVAMLVSGGFALATGAVALRTRGVTFIMITLAFAQMAYFVAGALAESITVRDAGTVQSRDLPCSRSGTAGGHRAVVADARRLALRTCLGRGTAERGAGDRLRHQRHAGAADRLHDRRFAGGTRRVAAGRAQ
jgi:ABC-type branched-subunit amino acid transport system permease subunit